MDSSSVWPETFSPVVPSCRGIDPFHMMEKKGRRERRDRGKKKRGEKAGLPSDTEMRGREWIGRVWVVCWFSSPDFTLADKG